MKTISTTNAFNQFHFLNPRTSINQKSPRMRSRSRNAHATPTQSAAPSCPHQQLSKLAKITYVWHRIQYLLWEEKLPSVMLVPATHQDTLIIPQALLKLISFYSTRIPSLISPWIVLIFPARLQDSYSPMTLIPYSFLLTSVNVVVCGQDTLGWELKKSVSRCSIMKWTRYNNLQVCLLKIYKHDRERWIKSWLQE